MAAWPGRAFHRFQGLQQVLLESFRILWFCREGVAESGAQGLARQDTWAGANGGKVCRHLSCEGHREVTLCAPQRSSEVQVGYISQSLNVKQAISICTYKYYIYVPGRGPPPPPSPPQPPPPPCGGGVGGWWGGGVVGWLGQPPPPPLWGCGGVVGWWGGGVVGWWGGGVVGWLGGWVVGVWFGVG